MAEFSEDHGASDRKGDDRTHRLMLVWLCGLTLMLLMQTISILFLVQLADDVRENGLQDRAVACRVLIGEGLPTKFSGPCYEPDVLRYYDPDDAVVTVPDGG